MGALHGFAEAGKSAGQADTMKVVASSGDELVGVALVGGVPNYAVLGTFEYAVNGESKLYDAQVGGEMSAALRDYGYDGVPGFLSHLLHLVAGEGLQVLGSVDGVQETTGHCNPP